MKLGQTIIKICVAIAAIAGIAFLVVKYMDTIKSWLQKLCPCCRVEDEVIEETEEPVEEPTAEEVPAAQEAVVEEATPVAEATDFED